MLELNKSYAAQFLGRRQLLSGAVTSDLLSGLVQDLPDAVSRPQASSSHCIVQCNASGLTVSHQENGNGDDGTGSVIAKLALRDILFCHVDKGQPDVTVWVVRAKDDDTTTTTTAAAAAAAAAAEVKATAAAGAATDVKLSTGSSATMASTSSAQAILQAYIYRCLNKADAVGLFKIYNEINRQAKFDKYRKNGEKKEEVGATNRTVNSPEHGPESSQASREVCTESNGTSSDSEDNSVAVIANASVKAASTTTSVAVECRNPSKSATLDDMQLVNHSPTWSTIADNIANYRKSFRILRPRDKEVRAALLSELRQKLNGSPETDGEKADQSQGPSNGVKSKSESRQRKPAKTIAAVEVLEPASARPQVPATKVRGSTKNSFQFPWSNAVKKLVNKKSRNNGYVLMTSSLRPQPLPVPESHSPVWYLQSKGSNMAFKGNGTAVAKTKSTKGQAQGHPLSTAPAANAGVDPYFYLPPLSTMQEPNAGRNAGQITKNSAWLNSQRFVNDDPRTAPKKSLLVASPIFKVIRPDDRERNHNHNSYPTSHRYCNVNHHSHQHVHANGNVSSGGVPNKKVKPGAHPGLYGIGRFSRSNHNKKRMPTPNGTATTFYRTSSTGSRGSSSSESGPDNRLRSVMKKPKQINENTPPEQKKNVTFHAYATVKVLT